MTVEFTHDVFLSHSSDDKTIAREIAERLRDDGIRVWFDQWEILPDDSIPAQIEAGLEHSRVLVLCMSANAFGSDWAQLEAVDCWIDGYGLGAGHANYSKLLMKGQELTAI